MNSVGRMHLFKKMEVSHGAMEKLSNRDNGAEFVSRETKVCAVAVYVVETGRGPVPILFQKLGKIFPSITYGSQWWKPWMWRTGVEWAKI